MVLFFGASNRSWHAPIGHCGKLEAMLRIIHREQHDAQTPMDWIVVADDDTRMDVPKLLNYLSYMDPAEVLLIGIWSARSAP
jgi:hypothetical protein